MTPFASQAFALGSDFVLTSVSLASSVLSTGLRNIAPTTQPLALGAGTFVQPQNNLAFGLIKPTLGQVAGATTASGLSLNWLVVILLAGALAAAALTLSHEFLALNYQKSAQDEKSSKK